MGYIPVSPTTESKPEKQRLTHDFAMGGSLKGAVLRWGKGGGGHAPRFTISCPPESKASWKNASLDGVCIFQFQRKDKMDSVMKGLMGQCPHNFWTRTTLEFKLPPSRMWAEPGRQTHLGPFCG